MFETDKCTACEADARMTVEYQGSTLTNMDIEDSKIAYKQLSGGSKLRYSGNKITTWCTSNVAAKIVCTNSYLQLKTQKSLTLKTPYSWSHLYI